MILPSSLHDIGKMVATVQELCWGSTLVETGMVSRTKDGHGDLEVGNALK